MPSKIRPQRERGTREHRHHREEVERYRRALRRRWPFAKSGHLTQAAGALKRGGAAALRVYVIPDKSDPLKARILVGGAEPEESNLSGSALLRAIGME